MGDISLSNQPGKWRLRWVISKNELLNVLRHPNYLILLAIPIFMNLVFGIMFEALQGTDAFIVVVYDQGKSSWIAELNELPDIEWQFVNSETAVLQAVEEEATGGLIIPANFDTAVGTENPPELLVYVNQDASRAHIIQFRQGIVDQLWKTTYASPPATINWQKANLDEGRFTQFSVDVYITVMFIIMGVTIMVINIVSQLLIEERSNGVFSMLMASPMELTDMLFGQSFATLLFAILGSFVLLLINMKSINNWLMSMALILILAVVLNGLGLILGLTAGSKGQCHTFTSIAGILLIIPVWFMVVTVEELPTIVSWLLQLTPTYHFGIIFIRLINETATLSTVGVNLVALLLFGVLFYGIVHWLTKRPLMAL